MTDNDPLDDLVKAHLDREAARVDAARVLAGVRGRAVPRRAWLKVAAGAVGVGLAAGVGALYFLGESPPVQQARAATAEELVEAARAAHAAPLDRGYDVTAEWTPGLPGRLLAVPPVRKFRLWTRGDQFWIESAADGATAAWGQEANGRFWAAPTRRRGLEYDPSEVGEPITRYCELMSLRVVSTLAEVLEKFDLSRQDAGTPGEPIRLRATIRPTFLNRNPRFREVSLTLDPETKVIREAVLKRTVNGETVATLTFTLTDTTPQPADAYHLRGHLDADAEVLGTPGPPTDRRARYRDEFLKRMRDRVK